MKETCQPNVYKNEIAFGDDFVITVKSDIGYRNDLRLLVDTGASCSLIKINRVKPTVNICSQNSVRVEGIFDGIRRSFGTCMATLGLWEGVNETCTFQVIPDTQSFAVDGILGADFLMGKFIVDCVQNKIKYGSTVEVIKGICKAQDTFPVWSNDVKSLDASARESKTMLDRVGEQIRKGSETNSIDSNMDKQLGNSSDKRAVLERIKTGMNHKIGNVELGILKNKLYSAAELCREFLLNNQETSEECIENSMEEEKPVIECDYSIDENEAFLQEIEIEEVNDSNVQEPDVPFNNCDEVCIDLEPRTETILKVKLSDSEDRVCLSEEVQDGVFVSNAIVRPKNGFAWVGFVNTRNEKVRLYDFQPRTESLKDYRVHVGNGGSKAMSVEEKINRFRLLKENLALSENLSEEERGVIETICREYCEIFHLPGDKLSYSNVRKFTLPLIPGAGVVNRKQYRIPEKHRSIMQREIERLLEEEIIEPSTSPFNSPVLLVPKKGVDAQGNKQFRLCVDFRELNKVCIPYSFPLPRIEDILDQLGNSVYFSTLDLSQGFHQVLIEESDREKTAFSSNIGHYQYKRCPFGLKTIPSFFQSLLNNVLTGLQGIKCFVYLDDVVIFARNLTEHNKKLVEVLDRFRSSNLKLNPRKCKFLEKEIVYLGHHCSARGVEPDPRLINSVKEYPRPKTAKELQSFLGLANYYRRFIKGFSLITVPMRKQLKKDQKFLWDNECESAFKELKNALTTTPVLAYPQFDKDFVIVCDASKEGLGAILEQESSVICYASRSLTPAERNWSATELELNAIVFACRAFKCYILGRKTKVYSDHMALRGQMKMLDTTARIVRLQQKLSEFDLEICYKKGKENGAADCLSRIPRSTNSSAGQESCFAVTRSAAKKLCELASGIVAQSVNEEKKLTDVAQSVNEETKLADVEENDWIDVHEDVGIEKIDNEADKLVILRDYHGSRFGGHFGIAKTLARIKNKYDWKGMRKDVQDFIRKCPKCQKNKVGRVTRMPLVMPVVSQRPFDKIYIDLVGPLPLTEPGGNKYILSMVDDLTRFVEFTAIPNQEAKTVAKALYEGILCRYTIPKAIVTDNGANFISNVINQLCKLLGVTTIRISPYHAQSNAVERQHSTLANYVRCFVDEHPTNWDTYLRTAAHAYNNTMHMGTKYAPMELLFGFISEIPSSLKRKPEPIFTYDMYHKELRHKLQKSFDIARKNLKRAKEVSKLQYDKKSNPVTFHLGDKVLLKAAVRNNKFSEHWKGPFEIVHVHSPENVSLLVKGKVRKVHANRIKLFYE